MKKPKAPRLVTVAIFTTITIIFWIFMSLYNIITSEPPINVDPELLKPINPTLDQDALNRLEERVFFEEGETNSPIIVREEETIIPPPDETPVDETTEDDVTIEPESDTLIAQ